ncbi:cobalamin synthesis protein/P47K family protein [Treponema primitia ZAS-2]|uniref:Cobalamin synthesis protein/P47K family protein n=1 Tax=Treponema primitia (strain ATCC BAA-887 / DSM 12427 / ZAS-2) TaxID=545694 RepID=F5YKH3_TREPZ|nr:GTP-binding protein [Treponema primitia]AEF84391.1 cobalamin synthesis protein/P47K family protein [Treponema primitia ZAS-2]
MNVQIIVLGGFLGSGKTTVLLELAKYLTGKQGQVQNTRVVIIENEISEAGMDSRLFEKDYRVKNLFSGCACCTYSGEFEAALQAVIRDYEPEWIIVEATGLAYPDAIKASVQKSTGIIPCMLTVADAKRWFRALAGMEQFVEGQLREADIILVNKVDLAGEAETAKVIDSISAKQSAAQIVKTTASAGLDESFWNDILKPRRP